MENISEFLEFAESVLVLDLVNEGLVLENDLRDWFLQTSNTGLLSLRLLSLVLLLSDLVLLLVTSVSKTLLIRKSLVLSRVEVGVVLLVVLSQVMLFRDFDIHVRVFVHADTFVRNSRVNSTSG